MYSVVENILYKASAKHGSRQVSVLTLNLSDAYRRRPISYEAANEFPLVLYGTTSHFQGTVRNFP